MESYGKHAVGAQAKSGRQRHPVGTMRPARLGIDGSAIGCSLRQSPASRLVVGSTLCKSRGMGSIGGRATLPSENAQEQQLVGVATDHVNSILQLIATDSFGHLPVAQ